MPKTDLVVSNASSIFPNSDDMEERTVDDVKTDWFALE
jgi:hypothetical protein